MGLYVEPKIALPWRYITSLTEIRTSDSKVQIVMLTNMAPPSQVLRIAAAQKAGQIEYDAYENVIDFEFCDRFWVRANVLSVIAYAVFSAWALSTCALSEVHKHTGWYCSNAIQTTSDNDDIARFSHSLLSCMAFNTIFYNRWRVGQVGARIAVQQ